MKAILDSCFSPDQTLRSERDVEMPGERGLEVDGLLLRMRSGDESAEEDLFAILYGELKDRAGGLMRGQPRGHTLQATALLNEAFLRLARRDGAAIADRSHFLAVASRAMKSVLIDHARGKARLKRGGDHVRVCLDGLDAEEEGRTADLLDLTDALERLAKRDPRAAQVVELRFFGGLGIDDAAEVIGASPRSVQRDYRAAKAWLRRALS